MLECDLRHVCTDLTGKDWKVLVHGQCAQGCLIALGKSTIGTGCSVLSQGQLVSRAIPWWPPPQPQTGESDPQGIRAMASPCPLSPHTAPCLESERHGGPLPPPGPWLLVFLPGEAQAVVRVEAHFVSAGWSSLR